MAARLTPLSKLLITAVVLGGVGTMVYRNKDKLASLAPGRYVLSIEARSQLGGVDPIKKEIQVTIK